MSPIVELFVAPAAAGKTAYAVETARSAAAGLAALPRVLVPGLLQGQSWRRRLGESGGSLGVRVLTFDQLCQECLSAAGEVYVWLSEPVQYRLIRAVVDGLPLQHYAALAHSPGFIQVLEGLIAELQSAGVQPERFGQAVTALGAGPRLEEIARVYAAYAARMEAMHWAGRPGLALLTVAALRRDPNLARNWPLLIVDGFDTFAPVQRRCLELLAGRVGRLLLTLTGDPLAAARPQAHKRLLRTCAWAEALAAHGSGCANPVASSALPNSLGFAPPAQQVENSGLPAAAPSGLPNLLRLTLPAQQVDNSAAPTAGERSFAAPALAHLEANLFRPGAPQVPAEDAITLIEAPDRASEVRAALRWLKARLAEGSAAGDLGLLARDLVPYRSFILETAAEFGLPVYLAESLPLRSNPAVAALLDLLRLSLPVADGADGLALPTRLVLAAWRAPYFDWSALPAEDALEPIKIAPGDANRLAAAALWGKVLGGSAQWLEVLDDLAARSLSDEATGDDEREVDPGVPTGPGAAELAGKLRRCIQRLTPPAGVRPYRAFVAWVEGLIGPDPTGETALFPTPEEPAALNIVGCARAWPATAERDIAALQGFKDVLRGLAWAEEVLAVPPVDYAGFFDELIGAVDTAGYLLPPRVPSAAILVADVLQARGVPLRAMALLGLAEGEFPATLHEDPFLSDADRARLRDEWALPLEPSAESVEAQRFYEAITRPRERLLLTRPRLADNGSPWQPSPFWDEVRRLVEVEPLTLKAEQWPDPTEAASWPEYLACLAAHGVTIQWDKQDHRDIQDDNLISSSPSSCPFCSSNSSATLEDVQAAAAIFRLRSRRSGTAGSLHDGDLTPLADEFARRFGPDQAWSASRLEKYGSCPYAFFAASVLGLAAREEPVEGLDVRQLGNIYHRIFARLHAAVADPGDLAQLLARLPDVAQAVLDAAPRQEGFRANAWWEQTRAEIEENVRRSLIALAGMEGHFVPIDHEVPFWGEQSLTITEDEDAFRLHGYIDRVDLGPGGFRIIDYKTGGPSDYKDAAVIDGLKLQLALYARAARDALGLGRPVDGYYWHVTKAERSPFSLAGFKGGSTFPDGPEGAMAAAVAAAWLAVRAARTGAFVPHPPHGGCPDYCVAAAFCWHYRSQRGD
jgi:hypothetical protein